MTRMSARPRGEPSLSLLMEWMSEAERAQDRGKVRRAEELIEGVERSVHPGHALEQHLRTRIAHLRLALASTEEIPPAVREVDLQTDFGIRHPNFTDEIRTLGSPMWSARNSAAGPDSADLSRMYWWKCSRDSRHNAWQASTWQFLRGRPCPACLREIGWGQHSWQPDDIGFGLSELPGAPRYRPFDRESRDTERDLRQVREDPSGHPPRGRRVIKLE